MKALMFVGASTTCRKNEALKALFDRFLLRVRSNNVAPNSLLGARCRLETSAHRAAGAGTLHFDDMKRCSGCSHSSISRPCAGVTRSSCTHPARRARHVRPAGGQLQALIAASALLSAPWRRLSDLWC